MLLPGELFFPMFDPLQRKFHRCWLTAAKKAALTNRKVQDILNNSRQYRSHQSEVTRTDSRVLHSLESQVVTCG